MRLFLFLISLAFSQYRTPESAEKQNTLFRLDWAQNGDNTLFLLFLFREKGGSNPVFFGHNSSTPRTPKNKVEHPSKSVEFMNTALVKFQILFCGGRTCSLRKLWSAYRYLFV